MVLEMDLRYHDALKPLPPPGGFVPAFGRCLLALEEGQITMRDLDLLRELAYSQYLTREQLQFLSLSGVSKSVMRRRLEVAVRLGLLAPIRWDEERVENTPAHRVAYCLALNGAKLLRHHHGLELPWRPGMAQKHLRKVLGVLAVNQFRIQMLTEKPDLIEDWQMFTHPEGPVARFSLGGQMVLLDAPRGMEDAHSVSPQKWYAKWADKQPLLFFITPDEQVASVVFQRLKDTVTAERLLFSTDERAFGTPPAAPGFVWQWQPGGQVLSLALA